MIDSEAPPPRVFVSYSWDNEDHRSWVRNFATRLRGDGVDAKLDQWGVRLGDPLTQFMEESIRNNDFVLIVCTPGYRNRSDGRIGGVGYEGDIMTAEVYTTRNQRKFIPVLRMGDWNSAPPSWLSGKRGVDLRGDSYSEDEYRILVQELHGQTHQPPALGQRPSYTSESTTVDYADVVASPPNQSEMEAANTTLETLPTGEVPKNRSSLPLHSVMPLRPNPNFVGRREDLKEIAAKLKAGDATAIGEVSVAASSGLGGVGKTQLVVEFVHRYGRYFHGVYWLNFGNPATIPAQVAFCGGTGGMNLRPREFDTLTMEERVRSVMAEWQSELPRLLVFDNCEDEDLLEQWLPPTGGCRVLVTSRRESWDPSLGVSSLSLGVLDRQESVELLRKHRPDLSADDPVLNAIAQELGDLPLALDLAGRYLKRYERDVSLQEYLAEIQSQEVLEHESLRKARGISPTKHEMDVWRTFAVSYWRLDENNETDGTAVRLLARAAYLSAGALMPDELLSRLLDPYGQPNSGPILPATRFRDAVERLREIGLLGEEEAEGYVMHRLVAAFAVAEVGSEADRDTAEKACERAALQAYEEGHPSRQETLLPHVRTLADAAMEREDELAARLCRAAYVGLVQIHDYDGALLYAQRSADIAEDLYGRTNRLTLQNRSNVGQVLNRMGEREAAKIIYEEVLATQEEHLGREDPDVAATLNNMGMLLWGEELYHEMLPLYERALSIRARVWRRSRRRSIEERRKSASEAAQSYHNMGAIRMDLGRPRQAEPCFHKASNIMTGEFGRNHERKAGTLVARGQALWALGREPEALDSIKQALDVYREVASGPSEDADRAFANFGCLHAEIAEHRDVYECQRAPLRENARCYLQLALNGVERGYGEDHPVTGGLNRALGKVHEAQGAGSEARNHLQRAAACCNAYLSGTDEEAAGNLNRWGKVLVEWGLYDEARAYLERAVEIRLGVLGEHDFRTSNSFFKLGVLFQIRGQNEHALEALQRALDARAAVCGEDHPATELVRENLRLLDS